MHRHRLHVLVAMLTFMVSTLASSKHINLVSVVSSALAVFVLTQVVPDLKINPHYLKVGFITLILWAALGYMVFTVFLLPAGSCIAIADWEPTIETNREQHPDDALEAETDGFVGLTVYSCSGDSSLTNSNTIWAGILDKKAIAKPAPLYPATAKSAMVKGVVAVSVVVDESGKVLWLQSLSGHPLLRQAVMEAACRARFHPTLVNGPPVRVGGVLTYKF
jgi:TonB family protein